MFPAASSLCGRSVKGLHETVTGRGSPLKRDPLWEGMLNATTHGLLWRRLVWVADGTGGPVPVLGAVEQAKGRGPAWCWAPGLPWAQTQEAGLQHLRKGQWEGRSPTVGSPSSLYTARVLTPLKPEKQGAWAEPGAGETQPSKQPVGVGPAYLCVPAACLWLSPPLALEPSAT